MTARLGQHVAHAIGIAAGDLRLGAQHHEAVQVAQLRLCHRRGLARQLAHMAQGREVIDGLKVILERLAADRDALLDDEGGLDGAEGVSLDGARCVGELDVLRSMPCVRSKLRSPPGARMRCRSSSAFFSVLVSGQALRVGEETHLAKIRCHLEETAF